jgi:undecaprenyl-diphosphatase
MSPVEAVILGLIQGLTEFLPVSSSGHLTIAGTLFGLDGKDNLAFAVIVHVATALSALVVLRKEIAELLKGLMSFAWNDEAKLVAKLLLSMAPVAVVGLFFKDTVEHFFGSGLFFVGLMLFLTAALLMFAFYARPRQKDSISFSDAIVIGIAQACAVLPGLSRSGSTIATGILLGNNRGKVAKFSFLMVIVPVLGEAILDTLKAWQLNDSAPFGSIPTHSMLIGFVTAFISGFFACRWMLEVVKRGKLVWFAYYCIAIGLFAIICSILSR